MANDPKSSGIKDAVVNMNVKTFLAFFLVIVAASLVVYLINTLTGAVKGTLDAGTIALFASFVTMFIKMASDATGFQFSSSAGSEKKDEVNAAVQTKLAEKVGPTQPTPTVPVPPWWGRLKDDEKNTITAAAGADPRVAAFVTASQVGAANSDDLAYLVSKGLLTQDRATAIAA